MARQSVLLVIPGTHDDKYTKYIKFLMLWWRLQGYVSIIHQIHWENPESFASKLKKLSKRLMDLKSPSNTISVIGISAGGSAAVNLLCLYPQLIYKVIDICGPLRFNQDMEISSTSARASLRLCEKNVSALSKSIRSRIMTISAKFGDQVVPAISVPLKGAVNISFPSRGHKLTIALALTFFSNALSEFLNS